MLKYFLLLSTGQLVCYNKHPAIDAYSYIADLTHGDLKMLLTVSFVPNMFVKLNTLFICAIASNGWYCCENHTLRNGMYFTLSMEIILYGLWSENHTFLGKKTT